MTTIYEAQGFWARSYGWHRFAVQHPQQWLFLPRCSAVHSLGLSVSLWLLFVDRQGQPLAAWHELKPHRCYWHRGAYGVIETACADAEKRHQIQVALVEQTAWITHTMPWVAGCFVQKYCEK